MSQILDRLPEVVAQLRTGLGLAAVPGDQCSEAGLVEHSESELVGQLSAEEVEWFTRAAAEVMKLGEALVAIGAGQIAKLSERELGYAGLAQRRGMRTPEALVQSITGSTRGDAAKQVRVGTAVGEAEAAERLRAAHEQAEAERHATSDGTDDDSIDHLDFIAPVEVPWHSPLSLAVSQGKLSTAAAASITRGLGEPTDEVPGELLREAAERLLPLAETTDADELCRLAREERNLIDVAGIAAREKALRDLRGLRMLRRDSMGMRSVAIRLDPENEAIFSGLIDAVTSPRLGGPRFVDPADVAASESLAKDPRTTEQIALDAMMQLLELGAQADPDGVYTRRQPAVRIIVTAEDLEQRDDQGAIVGTGTLEDSREAVSGATVDRNLCGADIMAILMGSGNTVFEATITMRLFNRRQRRAMAARDGGCMFPGCDRPVSWTEAHHINPWKNANKTETADGILLCRHHHMLMHNNGWVIIRRDTDYYLVPPISVDPHQQEILLHSKSALMRRRKRELAKA
jgi:hypothetical protein